MLGDKAWCWVGSRSGLCARQASSSTLNWESLFFLPLKLKLSWNYLEEKGVQHKQKDVHIQLVIQCMKRPTQRKQLVLHCLLLQYIFPLLPLSVHQRHASLYDLLLLYRYLPRTCPCQRHTLQVQYLIPEHPQEGKRQSRQRR